MLEFALLTERPALGIPIATVFGLLVGSFLNVVIHRFPKMLERGWQSEAAAILGQSPADPTHAEPFNLAFPRSHCPKCGHVLSWWENIPLLSWAMLRGRCRKCEAKISIRYPVVEACAGLMLAFAAYRYGFTVHGVAAASLLLALLTLALIDFDTQLLPDQITLPLLWLGLAFNLSGGFVSLQDAVWGAMAGYLSLWSVYWAFKLTTGKEGMGYGDFKLLAALGAWLGWATIPTIILLSSLVGAVVGIMLIAVGLLSRDRPMPFGPYLAGAGVIALLLGPEADIRVLLA